MSDLQQTMARQIRKARTTGGMQQQMLAETVGVTRTSISNIENGRQALTLEMFCRIAQALNEDAGKFLNDAISRDLSITVSAKDVRNPKIRKQIINMMSKGGSDE